MPPAPHHARPYPRLLASHTLPPEGSSPAAARATVRAALPELGDDFVATVELLTCELVTNALVHAATACRLRLSEPRSGVVRVEVYDGTDSAPTISGTRPAPSGVNGRGLLIVDALATTWGARAHPIGKTVWFDIHT